MAVTLRKEKKFPTVKFVTAIKKKKKKEKRKKMRFPYM